MAEEDSPVRAKQQGLWQARRYQRELLEHALRRNVIACLPTGAGKTLIAILLIEELARRRAVSPTSSRLLVFFLANTVPLAVQQARAIAGHLKHLAVGVYAGDRTLDAWSMALP